MSVHFITYWCGDTYMSALTLPTGVAILIRVHLHYLLVWGYLYECTYITYWCGDTYTSALTLPTGVAILI